MAKAKESAVAKFVRPRSKTDNAPTQSKGNGKTIGVTLRLNPDDWETLRNYATANRTSIQQIALRGCAVILKRDGLTLKACA